MSRKSFIILQVLSVICILVEVSALIFRMVTDPFPQWGEYGAALMYILMFAGVIFMMTRISPSDISNSEDPQPDEKR